MKKGTLFWLALILGAVFGLYQVKYQVREVKSQADQLQTDLTKEYDALHVLRAEWTYLNRPERLQKLVERHLKLEPMQAAQMTDPEALEAFPANSDQGLIPASEKKHAR